MDANLTRNWAPLTGLVTGTHNRSTCRLPERMTSRPILAKR